MSSIVFTESASGGRFRGGAAACTGLGGREVLPYALAISSLDLVGVGPGLYDKPDKRFMKAVG
jgi:hypothetical protein